MVSNTVGVQGNDLKIDISKEASGLFYVGGSSLPSMANKVGI